MILENSSEAETDVIVLMKNILVKMIVIMYTGYCSR